MAARWRPHKQARAVMVTLPEGRCGRAPTDEFVEESLKKLQAADGAQSLKLWHCSKHLTTYLLCEDEAGRSSSMTSPTGSSDTGLWWAAAGSGSRLSNVNDPSVGRSQDGATSESLRRLLLSHTTPRFTTQTPKRDREWRATSPLEHLAGEELLKVRSCGMELKWIKRGDTQALGGYYLWGSCGQSRLLSLSECSYSILTR